MTSQHVGVDMFDVNTEFDYYDDIKICEKYVVHVGRGLQGSVKTGRTTKLSQIVENQFKFHSDTEQFRKNHHKIKPEDEISVTYKVHGTSAIASHILIKKNLISLRELLLS